MSTPPHSPQASTSPTRAASGGAAPYSIALFEHTYPLIWPLALRALGMGLRPTRIATAYFLIVALLLLVHVASGMMPKPTMGVTKMPALAAMEALRDAYADIDAMHLPQAAARFVALPITIATQFPRVGLLLALPVALLLGVMGGCVVRSSAVEFATGRRDPWAASMGQALTHTKALTLVLAGPMIVAGMLLAAAAVVTLPMSLGGMGAIAGVLFGIVLVLAFLAVLLLTLWVASLPIVLAAAVCEGEGALDATQRAFAYVASRPLRVLGYVVVLGVMGMLAMALAWWLVHATLTLAAWSAGNVLEPALARSVEQVLLPTWDEKLDGPYEQSTLLHVLAFWRSASLLLVPAVLLSTLLSGSSAIYLLLRQGIDGRDRRVIWNPREGAPASPAFLREANDESGENNA